MKSLAAVMAALSVGACVHSGPRDQQREMPPGPYCQMALAALRETIRPYDAQPFGLEKACVTVARCSLEEFLSMPDSTDTGCMSLKPSVQRAST